MPLIDDYFKVCEQSARAGGDVLRGWWGRISAREKGPKDLVTEADVAAQQAIRKTLLEAFPNHTFMGEEQLAETASPAAADPQYRWIVDPLDGTANYVHQMPIYAVSVALERKGEPLVGVVYNPVNDECFAARAGEGAYLNGARLKTSGCQALREALVAASFSANVQRDSPEINRFVDVLVSCQSVRRLGSAALNLCYVAAGRLDAYYATSVKAWDVAAGLLLVREAGGIVTAVDGTPFRMDRPTLVAAATPAIHADLVRLLNARPCPPSG